MAKLHQLSRKRPHIVLPPNKKPATLDRPPTPFTTFTALLDAANSCDSSTSADREYPAKSDAAPAPGSSVTKRRLRNRESCRKTRLKRKLQQHAQDVLARERQARNEYLQQLSDKLGVDTRRKTQEGARDTLFRDLASRSLHYALVDPEYSGWLDGRSSQATAETAQESEEEAHSSTRKSKRLRRSRDIDVAAASRSEPLPPQASMLSQWRLLVDGLQNVVLKLDRIEERGLGAGVFELLCHWRFVGVSSVSVQRDGEIDAVAVTGTTRVQFQRLHVQDLSIETVRREHNVPFEFELDGDK